MTPLPLAAHHAPAPAASPSLWTVTYDERCLKDAKKLDRQTVETIRAVVEDKLRREPEQYGEPYFGPLKGLWKLKYGKLRIAYAMDIKRHTVHVLALGWRHTIGEIDSIGWLQSRLQDNRAMTAATPTAARADAPRTGHTERTSHRHHRR